MRIGIDLYSFIPKKSFGVGPTNYAYTLVRHLIEQNKEHQFVLFTNKSNHQFFSEGENCKVIKNRMRPSKGFLRIVHEQVLLPYYFYKEKLDVIHFTGNVISFLLCKKSVFTVHDLMWRYYRDSNFVPFHKRFYYSVFCPISFKLARKIITVSGFIKNEIIENYHIDPKKVDVIFQGQYVKDVHLPSQKEQEFHNQFGNGFIFTVTTSWPHKNLVALLKAFNILKEKHKDFNRKLIIVGQTLSRNVEIERYIEINRLLEKGVIFLGYVSDEMIYYLYNHAAVFVFPSFYEGFGVPPLEAMKFGVPVVAAKAASMPEVCGDAALYADPNKPEEFADQVYRLLDDPQLSTEMIARGRRREKEYSWPKFSNEVMEVYKQIGQD